MSLHTIHPPRVVIDTNVLISALYRPSSASARILDACLEGTIKPLTSPHLREEYDHILPRAVRIPHWRRSYESFLELSEDHPTHCTPIGRLSPDPADAMLFELASQTEADFLITHDRVLLQVIQVAQTRVVRPSELLAAWSYRPPTP